MKQCFLSRGSARQMAWIPAPLAIEGKFVRIADENGWKVEKVYAAAPVMTTGDRRGFHHLFGSIA